MPKQEAPISQLQDYLPLGTYEPVLIYLRQFKVHLTVARERKSILGDYRHRTHHANHRISVNGNLNKYAFLITLLHELAHLLTFEQFGNKVMAHGREWKTIYGQLLHQFLQHKVFPPDIEKEIMASLHDPAASSCAEDGLLRVLRRYDPADSKFQLIEELVVNAVFRIDDGRVFQKGKKLRKRFRCTEIKTGRLYLFSPVYEVELLQSSLL
ncbi:MAG: SprT-like domain-containing protein [Chitinophagaceae bacterium]|nr:SprT-like domain-containing protein [Chitinophagaceae bacterium]